MNVEEAIEYIKTLADEFDEDIIYIGESRNDI